MNWLDAAALGLFIATVTASGLIILGALVMWASSRPYWPSWFHDIPSAAKGARPVASARPHPSGGREAAPIERECER